MRISDKTDQKLRELMRINENNQCFECDSKHPIYVVTELNIFVCADCSSYHRSQGRHVKGVGLCNFTHAELDNISKGGNELARRTWLATWQPLKYPKPDPTNRNGMLRWMNKKYNDHAWYAPIRETNVSDCRGGSGYERRAQEPRKQIEQTSQTKNNYDDLLQICTNNVIPTPNANTHDDLLRLFTIKPSTQTPTLNEQSISSIQQPYVNPFEQTYHTTNHINDLEMF